MRLHHVMLASVAVASVLLAGRVAGQDTTAVPVPGNSLSLPASLVGARVRIASTGTPGVRVGTIVALGPDTLRLRSEDGQTETPVALGRITRLERSTGRHGRALMGAGIGLVSGAALGGILGYASGDDKPQPNQWFTFTAGDKAAFAAAALGVVGLLTGTIVGALHQREEWKVIATTLPSVRTSRSVRPVFGIGLSFALR